MLASNGDDSAVRNLLLERGADRGPLDKVERLEAASFYTWSYILLAVVWARFITAIVFLRIEHWGWLAALCLLLFVPIFGFLWQQFKHVNLVYGRTHSILRPALSLVSLLACSFMGVLAIGACGEVL